LALLLSALALGFVLNAFRISILATLASPADEAAFAFWDHGRGASVFSLAETMIAGLWWWWMLRARSGVLLRPQLERA
jgi:exosortase/archaeosortase family protein